MLVICDDNDPRREYPPSIIPGPTHPAESPSRRTGQAQQRSPAQGNSRTPSTPVVQTPAPQSRDTIRYQLDLTSTADEDDGAPATALVSTGGAELTADTQASSRPAAQQTWPMLTGLLASMTADIVHKGTSTTVTPAVTASLVTTTVTSAVAGKAVTAVTTAQSAKLSASDIELNRRIQLDIQPGADPEIDHGG